MTELAHTENAPPATTAGGLLKAARQAAGLHLADLSVVLKVPVRQLESLEADQYRDDQSPVFSRGLAASVCRHLRVDAAPILALMPMSANYLESKGAVRQALSAPADLGSLRRSRFGAPRQTWWTATGMLFLIVALIWLPNPAHWGWIDHLRSSVSASEKTTPSDLVFSVQNTSWIEVWGAQNQLVWNGVLNAGEVKRLPVSLPVSVVVGRSDAVQLSVQGQPFDLKPHTQVNTARFEVKP